MRPSRSCLALLPFLPSLAFAEPASIPDAGTGFLQMLTGLGVVLAMLVGSLWLLKRLTQPRGANSALMRVVAGTAVGQRERVVVLEIGTTWLVLGVAPGEVSMLAEIPRQELPADPAGAGGKDFAGWLKQVVERRHGPQS